MKITYPFLGLLLCTTHHSCLAQSTFQNGLSAYEGRIKEKIIQKITDESQLSGDDSGKISIQAIPYCIFKPKLIKNENLTRFSIFIDSSSRMINELIFWNNILFSFPVPRLSRDSLFTSVEYPDWLLIKGVYEIPMVHTAQKYSKVYFYLKLLDREPAGNLPLAFLDHGVVRLIDRDLNVYSSIKEFVEKKYGSVDKYLEMWKDDAHRKKIGRHLSVDQAKAILRNDYHAWWQHFPTDTTHTVSLFLNQMDSFVNMQPEQKKLLYLKIKSDIDMYPECTCANEIVLFDRNVSHLILTVLTNKQYIAYIQGRSDYIWLLGLATQRLDTYYILERRIPIGKEDEIWNKEVFGQR